MKEEILKKLYDNPLLLDYLRYHPKWYQYIDQDQKNYELFEKTARRELKISTSDKLEKVKNNINFASALLKYISK